jgi:ferrous iron transport protein A
MTTDAAIPLRRLELGRNARIVSIRADGELGRRIRDMGLIPGETVQVTGRAPPARPGKPAPARLYAFVAQ